jgi:hypothetical protein
VTVDQKLPELVLAKLSKDLGGWGTDKDTQTHSWQAEPILVFKRLFPLRTIER